MVKTQFENLRIYKISEELSDKIWHLVLKWDAFAKNTMGRQLVNAVDSVGVNIAEGSGRGSYAENKRFAKIARGSLFECKHWLRRGYKRKLFTNSQTKEIKVLLDELIPKLSAYINSIGSKK